MKEKEDKRQSELIMYLPKIPTQVSTLHTNKRQQAVYDEAKGMISKKGKAPPNKEDGQF